MKFEGVQRLGFGVSGAHGTFLNSRSQTKQLLLQAYDLGIRIFDTGPSYGNGEAERRMGHALCNWKRDDVFVSTKIGLKSAWPNIGGLGRSKRDFSIKALRASFEASLRRVETDYFDCVFLHGPHPGELDCDMLKFLEALLSSGRVRYIGIAGRGGELEAACTHDIITHVMLPIYHGMNAAQLERFEMLRKAGKTLFGIETLKGVSSQSDNIKTAGQRYRRLKRLPSREPSKPAGDDTLSPRDAIKWSLKTAKADVIISTTTKASRLNENCDSVKALFS